MRRNWCEPECSRAALRSNDRESASRDFDDHVVAPYRVERRIKSHARAGGGRVAADYRRTVDLGGRLRGAVLAAVSRVGRRSLRGQAGPDRRAVARGDPGRGTVASQTATSRFSISSSRPSSPSRAAARRERGDQKQMALSEFDREFIRPRQRRASASRDAAVWHPGLMYQPVPRVLARRSVARLSASSHRLSPPHTRRTSGDVPAA